MPQKGICLFKTKFGDDKYPNLNFWYSNLTPKAQSHNATIYID